MTHRNRSKNVRLVGHHQLNGYGNGGQVAVTRRGNEYFAFIGHMKGMGTSILNVTEVENPEIVTQIPIPENTHSHKVRVCDNLMLVNSEQLGVNTPFNPGLKIYDISKIQEPKELSFFKTGGKGVHKFWIDPKKKIAYISTEMDGYLGAIFMIIDFNEPTNPFEISRWWLPGQNIKAGEKPTWNSHKRIRHHHPVVHKDRAYLGYWDAGFIILDISKIEDPRMISQTNYSPPYGGAFHTALPIAKEIQGRKWMVVFQESIAPYNKEGKKKMWVIDITFEENPVSVSTYDVPVKGFDLEKGRFGPHQPHEDIDLKNNLIFASWFSGGLRVIDLSNPYKTNEVGFYIPDTPKCQSYIQTNDVFVDDRNFIYIIDRLNRGLDILEFLQ